MNGGKMHALSCVTAPLAVGLAGYQGGASVLGESPWLTPPTGVSLNDVLFVFLTQCTRAR